MAMVEHDQWQSKLTAVPSRPLFLELGRDPDGRDLPKLISHELSAMVDPCACLRCSPASQRPTMSANTSSKRERDPTREGVSPSTKTELVGCGEGWRPGATGSELAAVGRAGVPPVKTPGSLAL